MAINYLTGQEVKLAELYLLEVFDEFCRENSLRYSLAYGTLLGAVRHKGFIPWDDDIDVIMPIEDYNQFRAMFPKRNGEKSSTIKLASQFNFAGKNAIPFEKLVDASIQVKSSFIAKDIQEYVWLDIFPVVSFSDAEEGKRAVKQAERYKHLFQASRWSSGQGGVKGRIKAFAGGIARHTSLQQWSFEKLAEMAEGRAFLTDGPAANVAWPVYSERELFCASLFNELVECEFERKRFLGLADSDAYLKTLYGNYMTLPPEEKRVSHELKAWRTENSSTTFGSYGACNMSSFSE